MVDDTARAPTELQPISETNEIPMVGDNVRKVSGYAFDGTIQAVFYTRAHVKRIVVESTLIPGLVHIFNDTQLALVGEPE